MKESVECLLENCSCLLFPTSGDGEAMIEQASVVVAAGKIIAIGPASELADKYEPERRIAGNGRLLTPGFVDSHTHLVFAGDRSAEFIQRCQGARYEEIAAAGGGIRATVRATRAASEEQLFNEALPRLNRMLALGTTTIEIKSGYGLQQDAELRMLRVIRRLAAATPARVVATFMGAHEIPDEHRILETGRQCLRRHPHSSSRIRQAVLPPFQNGLPAGECSIVRLLEHCGPRVRSAAIP